MTETSSIVQTDNNSATMTRFAKCTIPLRLYSAGEHLATAIAHMLELSPSEVSEFKEGKGSLQARLGQYLRGMFPEHELTKGAMTLANSKDWALAISYRNDWVHNKPPMVAGLGINCERKRRWVQSEDERSWIIGIGEGDEPTHQVETLQESFIRSLAGLMEFAVLCAEAYQEILGRRGFEFEDGRLHIRFGDGVPAEGNLTDG